ncbi:BfmA/BtgA family mobilization protein [Maribacter sp. 2304DJ31-5]|uniref:BfmA/BtgA family mobilization protein n=1 Tax=Maribacter sp. 2304DJ31-5 TaxID=3386273 RepID=UPI0039BCEC99
MELKKKRKSDFTAISINRITASRFREYSKEISKSHSQTLDCMIDFFEETNTTPLNRYTLNLIKFQNEILKRLEYIIELIREQERKYHKPTYEMLKSLFDGKPYKFSKKVSQNEEEEELMFKEQRLTKEEWLFRENVVEGKEYERLSQSNKEIRSVVSNLIDKLIFVKPTFGTLETQNKVSFHNSFGNIHSILSVIIRTIITFVVN